MKHKSQERATNGTTNNKKQCKWKLHNTEGYKNAFNFYKKEANIMKNFKFNVLSRMYTRVKINKVTRNTVTQHRNKSKTKYKYPAKKG